MKKLNWSSLLIFLCTLFFLGGFINPVLAEEKSESISDADLTLYQGGINPAEILVDNGQELFSAVKGKAGKSCASCHDGQNPSGGSLEGVAANFPKFTKTAGQVTSLQKQVNACETKHMQSELTPLKSKEMVSMVLYVKSLSEGAPVNVKVDGEAQKMFELGKLVFEQRRGQRNMSCQVCHDMLPGRTLRMQKLAKIGVAASHWPAYRMKKGETYLIEQRFQQCMKNARMKPLKEGTDPMIALELYITNRAKGAPVEIPGWVR